MDREAAARRQAAMDRQRMHLKGMAVFMGGVLLVFLSNTFAEPLTGGYLQGGFAGFMMLLVLLAVALFRADLRRIRAPESTPKLVRHSRTQIFLRGVLMALWAGLLLYIFLDPDVRSSDYRGAASNIAAITTVQVLGVALGMEFKAWRRRMRLQFPEP